MKFDNSVACGSAQLMKILFMKYCNLSKFTPQEFPGVQYNTMCNVFID